MEVNKLTQGIFKDKHPCFASWFAQWCESSKRFRDFVEQNKPKIRHKVDGAKTYETFRDVWYEFEMAYLILQSGDFSEVRYEKYRKKERAPDFTVTHITGTVFNVEVCRIRKPKPQKRFENWKKDIKKQIPGIPSTLAVSIWIDIDEFDPSPDLLERLENKRLDIVNCIISCIPNAEKNTPIDGAKRYPVTGFKGEVELEFRKPSSKSTPTLSYYGMSYPTLRTPKEYYKFGDKVCEKLGQMRPGEINILAVFTDGDTLDDFDLELAVASLNDLAALRNDDFFQGKNLADTDDFLEQFKRLGGVFFRGPWRNGTSSDPNRLWSNQGADRQIPQEICKVLRRMG